MIPILSTSFLPKPAVRSNRSAARVFCAALLLLAATSMSSYAVEDLSEPAPNFTLRSDAGNKKLLEQRGEIVVLSFWASWCDLCLQQLRSLKSLGERDDIVVWSIALDDDMQKAQQHVKHLDLNFPVLFDVNQWAAKQFDIKNLPEVIIVDRDGKIRFRSELYRVDQLDEYQKQLDILMKEYRVDTL